MPPLKCDSKKTALFGVATNMSDDEAELLNTLFDCQVSECDASEVGCTVYDGKWGVAAEAKLEEGCSNCW